MVVSREEFNMKLGIIGSGMIVYDLLTFIDIIDEIELTAILGRKESQEKIETLINKHHIKKAYYDYDELLNDDEIDTIYVAYQIISITNIQKKPYCIINMLFVKNHLLQMSMN